MTCTAQELEFPEPAADFFAAFCYDCHDGSDDERVDLSAAVENWKDPERYRELVRAFDRIELAEMPPADVDQPTAAERDSVIRGMKDALTQHSRNLQKQKGRSGLRRLTPTEYEHSLNDLFGIQAELKGMIPSGGNSNSFDTVAANQGFTALHATKYLKAAEQAIDLAIRLDPKPEASKKRYNYKEHKLVRKEFDDAEGKQVIGETPDAIVIYEPASYVYKLYDLEIVDGWYNIRAEASSHQSPNNRPVVLTLHSGDYRRGTTRLLSYFDIDNTPRVVESKALLRRGEYLFPGVADLLHDRNGKNVWNIGAKDFKGSGVALKWVEIEGPLFEQWPPKSTTDLLPGIEIKKLPHIRWDQDRRTDYQYEIVNGDRPLESLDQIVQKFAERAFRQRKRDISIAPFLEIGRRTFKVSKNLDRAIRASIQSMLTSPEFLFFLSNPGPLDDHSLASRLSYFLWKTLPDQKLRSLANEGRLRDANVLTTQIDRMLDHPHANRFVDDFTDQWLRLSEIDATSPDTQLYPEFDPLLKSAMLEETRRTFKYLIDENLSTDLLIDSDFVFVNRRLAEHYEIPDVVGSDFRRVSLPPESPRGGLMTQASILKVTANGTVTSPVRRGAWVLTHLLGTPPNPPPPNVGSIEPDTRGAATIRELLEKHRSDTACASCHNQMDPPGFALESFDVIGGFRTKYRSKKHGQRPTKKLRNRPIWEYRLNLDVDASGQSNGESFEDINAFKRILLKNREQVARNLIEQLIVYSTGAEIQFADREVVESILEKCRGENFGVRTIVREVILSPVFLNK